MTFLVTVDNIKCGGCANSIMQKIVALEGVNTVSVDVESGIVECHLASDEDRIKQEILQKLTSMGYPEVGSLEGLNAAGAKAKSFVSCAVGRMTSTEDENH